MRWTGVIAALLALALATAACGASAAPSGVASVGSSTSSTSGGGAGNSGAAAPTQQQLAAMTKFAECVRRHGEPKFPDPPYQIGELNSLGFRKGSPQMLAATNACHADALAAGVVQTQAELQQELARLLKISTCMRDHGIANFPDPSPKGGLFITPSIAAEPGYANASKACGGPPAAPPSEP